MTNAEIKTHYRACHLCEAICGLEIKTQGDEIISIKGDKLDPVSEGFICPKATAIADIHNDPDRLRKPIKKIDGEWQEVSWAEALDYTAEKLVEVQKEHGDNSVGYYSGNPNIHNYGNMTHSVVLRKALRTINHFSATSLDQLPLHLAAYSMFGHQYFLPVIDIDRTQLLVIFGGNPMASNGSLISMPNTPKRFKRLRERGGRLIVVDPRRTETANVADQHHFIKPGSDAFVLMAIINTLFAENLVSLNHLEAHLENLHIVEAESKRFTLELAEKQSGIPASSIKQLAYDLATADQGVLYGRMGISVQEFGTICNWAIHMINILIGALDKEGGALLSSPAFGYVTKGASESGRFNVRRSRVRGLPEFAGEFPSATLAEEILTPGEGQIKAMITAAGNPAISATNSRAINDAFESLDFYVAFDLYVNATTRHADIILPPTSPIEHEHYDLPLLRLVVRDSTRLNPAIFEPEEGTMHDWEIYNALAERICNLKNKPFEALPSPEKVVAKGISEGFYGEQANPSMSLSMEKIKASKRSIDLGPLKTGVVKRICTPNGKIQCAPEFMITDLNRLFDKQVESAETENDFLLIGRRHIRSNNSWMHNYNRLVKGKPRWQLLMHPEDLELLAIEDESEVTVTSRVGEITTTVLASDEVMRGVVSLPHGWGHNLPGVKMKIAVEQQGVNCNILTDNELVDSVSGNAALNGVRVSIKAA